MVGARFSVGWTINAGNPAAWLLLAGFLAGFLAAPADLAPIAAAGM